MSTLYTVGKYEFSDIALKTYGIDDSNREDFSSDESFAESLKNQLVQKHTGMWSMGLDNSGKLHLGIDDLPSYAREAYEKALDEVPIDDETKTIIGNGISLAKYSNISLKQVAANYEHESIVHPSQVAQKASDFLKALSSNLGDKADIALNSKSWLEERKTFDSFSTAQTLDILDSAQKSWVRLVTAFL